MAPGRVTAMRGFVSQAVARPTKMPGSTVNPALRCCADDWAMAAGLPLGPVSLKHDGTDGPVKLVNTDGTAIERADGTANTGGNYQIITY